MIIIFIPIWPITMFVCTWLWNLGIARPLRQVTRGYVDLRVFQDDQRERAGNGYRYRHTFLQNLICIGLFLAEFALASSILSKFFIQR